MPIALALLVALLGLSAAVLIPFLFAAGTIAGALHARLRARPPDGHGDLRARTSSCSSGWRSRSTTPCSSCTATERKLATGGSREDAVVRTMATRGACRHVLGARSRDRPGRAPVRPGPVHPLARHRRTARATRLARRHADAAARAARPSRPPPGGTDRPSGLGCDGSASPGRSPRIRGRIWLQASPSSWRRPPAAATLEVTPGSISSIPGTSESVRGFELLRDRVGAGRRGADSDRRRHRLSGRRPVGPGPRGDRTARGRARARQRGAARRERHARPVRRPERPARTRDRRSPARLRHRRDEAPRQPNPQRPRPGGAVPGRRGRRRGRGAAPGRRLRDAVVRRRSPGSSSPFSLSPS